MNEFRSDLYKPPERVAGKLEWYFQLKRGPNYCWCILTFLPKERKFESSRETIVGRLAGWQSPFPERVEVLQALLPPEAIAECTAAAITANLPI